MPHRTSFTLGLALGPLLLALLLLLARVDGAWLCFASAGVAAMIFVADWIACSGDPPPKYPRVADVDERRRSG